jgi:cullin 3
LRVIKEAFEEFMNKDNRTAAFLALYVDDLMKTGAKEMTEAEAEDKLDKVIVIFRYINDKDVFESYYKNFLAKRLLSGKGFSYFFIPLLTILI